MAWYILDNNHKPVVSTGLESSKWMEDNPNRKRVAYDELTDLNGDDVRVSTVFLGLDYSVPWDKHTTPLLWETMIFGGEYDQSQERYNSYEDAVDGHQKMLNSVKGDSDVVSS